MFEFYNADFFSAVTTNLFRSLTFERPIQDLIYEQKLSVVCCCSQVKNTLGNITCSLQVI